MGKRQRQPKVAGQPTLHIPHQAERAEAMINIAVRALPRIWDGGQSALGGCRIRFIADPESPSTTACIIFERASQRESELVAVGEDAGAPRAWGVALQDGMFWSQAGELPTARVLECLDALGVAP